MSDITYFVWVVLSIFVVVAVSWGIDHVFDRIQMRRQKKMFLRDIDDFEPNRSEFFGRRRKS